MVGIYLLNLFLAFLQPKFDPALEMNDMSNDAESDEGTVHNVIWYFISLILIILFSPSTGPSLPTRQSDEFRPFIRRLPEFKFWYVLVLRMDLVSISRLFKFSLLCLFIGFGQLVPFWLPRSVLSSLHLMFPCSGRFYSHFIFVYHSLGCVVHSSLVYFHA